MFKSLMMIIVLVMGASLNAQPIEKLEISQPVVYSQEQSGPPYTIYVERNDGSYVFLGVAQEYVWGEWDEFYWLDYDDVWHQAPDWVFTEYGASIVIWD